MRFIRVFSLVAVLAGVFASIAGAGGAPFSVTSPSTPGAEVDLGYSATLIASGGGSGAHTWSVTGGQLPPGLTLSSDCKLSGTPTTAGTYTFTVTVNNGTSSASK